MLPRLGLILLLAIPVQNARPATPWEEAYAAACEALASSNRRRGNADLELLLQDHVLTVIRRVQIRPDLRIDYVQSARITDLDASQILAETHPAALPSLRVAAKNAKKTVQKKALFYYRLIDGEGEPEVRQEERSHEWVVECHPYDQQKLATALRQLLSSTTKE